MASTSQITAAGTSRYVSVNPPPSNEESIRSFPGSIQHELVGNVVVAVSVTACVSPFLTIVDKALVERSAGTQSILSSMTKSMATMLRNPIGYIKSPVFLYMWATYACTYTAANTFRTLVDNKTTLFVGTTAVNSTASLVKDRAYAKLFGTPTVATVPTLSYGLWIARDLCTISSGFLLPQYISQVTSLDPTAAQLATPLLAQLVAAPLHFCGYDVYNNLHASHTSLSTRMRLRWETLSSNYWPVVGARMLRILPGYGIAGVWNTKLLGLWNGQ